MSVGGSLRVAVILALFADLPEPTVTPEDLQAALFDGPSQYGTVTEYYREVSGGRSEVTGQTFPWTRSSLTMAEVVGDDFGLGNSGAVGQYLLEGDGNDGLRRNALRGGNRGKAGDAWGVTGPSRPAPSR